MNKYDELYDKAIVWNNSNGYSNWASRQERPKCTEVSKGLGRNLKKSKLAKDKGYQRFLAKVSEDPALHFSYEAFKVEWSTGGVEGGSCYDNSDPQPYSTGNLAPELVDFDSLLERLCPNITFLQYKSICSKVVKHSSYTNYEYYGNHTDYEVKYILFSELYEELNKRDLIPDD